MIVEWPLKRDRFTSTGEIKFDQMHPVRFAEEEEEVARENELYPFPLHAHAHTHTRARSPIHRRIVSGTIRAVGQKHGIFPRVSAINPLKWAIKQHAGPTIRSPSGPLSSEAHRALQIAPLMSEERIPIRASTHSRKFTAPLRGAHRFLLSKSHARRRKARAVSLSYPVEFYDSSSPSLPPLPQNAQSLSLPSRSLSASPAPGERFRVQGSSRVLTPCSPPFFLFLFFYQITRSGAAVAEGTRDSGEQTEETIRLGVSPTKAERYS